MLENLKIAKPCPANWDAMTGDERVRFCGQCKLHVYNLSGMTRNQAEDLLTKTEGSVCVRLYKRADGTVITQDCPVGLAALRRRVATLAASLFATVAVGFGAFFRTSDAIDGPKVEPRIHIPEDAIPLMGAPPPREQPVEPARPVEPVQPKEEHAIMGKVSREDR